MWSRITGKSNDAKDNTPAQTDRRKNEDQAPKRHRSGSTVSSNPARQKDPRGEDRDRGFTPTSTSFASTTKNPYPNTASPSVALSYSVVGDKTDGQYIPPGLVRNANLADQMPKSKGGRDERDKHQDRSRNSERRRERSLSRDRKQSERERPMSRDRGDKHREKIGKRDKNDKDRANDRRLNRSESGYGDEYGTSRALGDFNEQVGSAGFMQFPGQYDGGFVGEPQAAAAGISSHVQDQFPGQFPTQSTEPYRPPLAVSEGGPGLAAEYYGDAGQSVSDQPGVRLQSPSLIIGAEPHLQAALAVAAPPPEPSATGGVGAAASFFNGSFTPEPLKDPGYSQAPVGADGPSFYQKGSSDSDRPDNKHHSSSAPAIPTLSAATSGAAAGYYMSGGKTSQSQRPEHGSSGDIGYGVSSSSTSQHPSSQLPNTSGFIANNSKPSKPGKHSFQSSNIPMYAAGAAGLVAATFQNNHHSTAPSHSSAQHYPTTLMAQRHRHHGPLSKFVDFFKDPDGVAQFEEYTEYIGICRYCFAPGSSPRDAPRKHHHRRRRSNEHLGSSTRIDKESRYGSSDGEGRRRNKRSSRLATGVAGYGPAKVGESLLNQQDDFESTYSAKTRHHPSSTHGTHGSHSPDRRSITSRGVTRRSSDTHSRRRSRSTERVEKGVTQDGRVYKKGPHDSFLGGPSTTTYGPRHQLRARPRSRSRDRKSSVTEAIFGAAVGSSIAVAASRPRNRSPQKAFVRSKQRSRERSPDLPSVLRVSHPESHYGSHISHHSPPSSHRHKSHKKEKKGGFFNFGNGSSSSSDAGGFFSSGRKKQRGNRKSKAKGKDHRNPDVAIIGLGAAAAALALNGSRQGNKSKRIGDLMVRESKEKLGRGSQRDVRYNDSDISGPEDNLWESASEDESDSGDSALAYGAHVRRKRSQDSLSSESSGMGLWGWRWGSKKNAKDTANVHRRASNDHYSAIAGAAAAGLASNAAGISSVPDTQHQDASNSTASNFPLQFVHPVPTSDPSRFDVMQAGSVASSSQPITYSRPGPLPIQHPQPIALISPAVYSTQVPYSHSYSAPTGPPVFSQDPHPPQTPLVVDSRQASFNLSQNGMAGGFPSSDRLPHREAVSDVTLRRRETSPAAPSAEVISKPITSRRRSSLKEDSAVRFDLTKEQEDEGRREKCRESKEDEELRLQRKRRDKRCQEKEEEELRIEDERREKRRQEKADEELRIQSESLEKRRQAKEEESRIESERREAEELKQIERDRKAIREASSKVSPSEGEMSRAAPAIVGAVAAAAGVAIAAENSKTDAERDEPQEKRRRDRVSDRGETGSGRQQRSPEKAPKQLYQINNRSSSTQQEPVTSAPQAQAASKIGTSHFEYEDYASFFTPPEISSHSKGPKERVASANADNDTTVYQTPEIITREPSGLHGSSRPPKFSYAPDELGSDHAFPSWVPMLNLIEPTPPASRASSTRGAPSPVIQPFEEIVEHEKEQISKSTTPSKVTWGEPETHEYTVITPMEHRDQFIDSPKRLTDSEEDEPKVHNENRRSTSMQSPPANGATADHEPGYFGNDLEFAANLAAGLEKTGFDPSIVIDDPVFRRRDSPPGSEQVDVAEEAPKTKEASRRRRRDSPQEEVRGVPRSTMPGSFDDHEDFEPKLSKKDRKKRDKAAKRDGVTDTATDQYVGEASQSRNTVSEDPEPVGQQSGGTFDESDDRNRSKKKRRSKSDQSPQNSAGDPYIDSAPQIQSRPADESSFDALVSSSGATNWNDQQRVMTESSPVDIPLPKDGDQYDLEERRVNPESLDDDYYHDKKSKSKHSRSTRDRYESDLEDAPSIAATAPASTETSDGKKHRRKSKRSSSGYDDAASIVSSHAAIDVNRNFKKSSKKEKERKGGLFGLFSKSTDNLSEPNRAKQTPDEVTFDDFEEPKRKSKKSRDRKSSCDEEASSQPGGNSDKFEDGEEKDRSHKSQERKEKRSVSNGDAAQDSGRITQDLPAKNRDSAHSEEPLRGKMKGEDKSPDEQESVSFLGMRPEIPPPPDIPTATPIPPGHRMKAEARDIADIPTYAVDDLALLEENRRTILADRERHVDSPSTSNSQPTSPLSALGARGRRLSEVKTLDNTKVQATAASPTAVPFRWREPPSSPGFSRSSPSTPLSSLNQNPDIAPTRPKARPRSTEFKSSTEFRPLWLVERHGSRQEPAPKEVYPSLPSSHTTSRASSVHDPEGVYLKHDAEHHLAQSYFKPVGERQGLVIDTEKAAIQPDLLDSQEPTPTASSFKAAERGETSCNAFLAQPTVSSSEIKPGPDIEDRETAYSSDRQLHDVSDLFPHRRQDSPSRYTSEPPPNTSSALAERVDSAVPGNNHHEDEISSIQKAAGMAAIIAGSSAAGILATTYHEQRPNHSLPESHVDQPMEDDNAPVSDIDRNAGDNDYFQEAKFLNKKTKKAKKKDKKRSEANTNEEGTEIPISTLESGPLSPSKEPSRLSLEEQTQLQEKDAQDAVDSWFTPATPKKSKKDKKGKRRGQSADIAEQPQEPISDTIKPAVDTLAASVPEDTTATVEELASSLFDKPEVNLETPRHTADSLGDDSSALSKHSDSDHLTKGMPASEVVETMTAVAQDTKTLENDLPKADPTSSQPFVEDEWPAFGSKSKKKNKDKWTSVKPSEAKIREPPQADLAKTHDIDTACDIAEQQDKAISFSNDSSCQVFQVNSQELETVTNCLDLDILKETYESSSSKKRSKKSRNKAKPIAFTETTLKSPQPINRSLDDGQKPSKPSFSSQGETANTTPDIPVLAQTPMQDLDNDFAAIKKTKKGKKSRKTLREVDDIEQVAPVEETARALHTGAIEPDGHGTNEIQSKRDSAASFIGNEPGGADQESNHTPIKLPTDPFVYPEATPLPVDDDLDLLDALPESPLIIAAHINTGDLITRGLRDGETVHNDEVSNMANAVQRQLVSPEATPLPVDEDLDLLDSLPLSPVVKPIKPNYETVRNDQASNMTNILECQLVLPEAMPLPVDEDLDLLDPLPLSPVVKPIEPDDDNIRPSDFEPRAALSTTDAKQNSRVADQEIGEMPVEEVDAGTDDYFSFINKKKGKKGRKSKQSLPFESSLNQPSEEDPKASPRETVRALEDLDIRDQVEKSVVETPEEQLPVDEWAASSKKKGKKGKKQSLLAETSQSLKSQEKDLPPLSSGSQPVEKDSQIRDLTEMQGTELLQEPLAEDEWASFSKKGNKGKKQKLLIQEPSQALPESEKSEPSHLKSQQSKREIAEVEELMPEVKSDVSLVDLPEHLPKPQDKEDHADAGPELLQSSDNPLLTGEDHPQTLPEFTTEQSVEANEWALQSKKKKGEKGKTSSIQDFDTNQVAPAADESEITAEAPKATTDTAREAQNMLAEADKPAASSHLHDESAEGTWASIGDALNTPAENDDADDFSWEAPGEKKGKKSKKVETMPPDDSDLKGVAQIPPEVAQIESLPEGRLNHNSAEPTFERFGEEVSKPSMFARTQSETMGSITRGIDQSCLELTAVPLIVTKLPEAEEIEQARAVSPETAALLSRDDEKPPEALKAADIVPEPEFESEISAESRPLSETEGNTFDTSLAPIIEGEVSCIEYPVIAPHAELSIPEPADKDVDIRETTEGVQDLFDYARGAHGQMPTLSKKDKKKVAWDDDFDSPTPEANAVPDIGDIQEILTTEGPKASLDVYPNATAEDSENFSKGEKSKKKAKKAIFPVSDEDPPMPTSESEKEPNIGEIREGPAGDNFDLPVAAPEHLLADESEGPQKSKKGTKKAKKGKSSTWEDDVTPSIPEPEPILEITGTPMDSIHESLSFPTDKQAKPVMDEFTAVPKSKKDKKKAKKSKVLQWEDEGTTSTPEQLEAQELVTKEEDPLTAQPIPTEPKELSILKETELVAEELSATSKRKKDKKKVKKSEALSWEDEGTASTPEQSEAQELVTAGEDPLVVQTSFSEPEEPSIQDNFEFNANEFTAAPKSKKDEKKAKRKAVSWGGEGATSTPKHSEAQEPVITREDLPVAETTFKEAQEPSIHKDSKSIADDFDGLSKSKKNRKPKMSKMSSWEEEAPSATPENSEALDSSRSVVKSTREPIIEERTASLRPVVATEADSAADTIDSFPMGKKDKKKAKKKSKGILWEDESVTVTPERIEAPEASEAEENPSEELASVSRDSPEVEADADQVAAEKAVQEAIASVATSTQHTLDTVTDSRAEQTAQPGPDADTILDLKKSKKDRKKTKKAQAFSWDEEVAQAKTPQPRDESFIDTSLTPPSTASYAEESSTRSPQKEVVQESGHLDFVQPFETPVEALHVDERDYEHRSAETEYVSATGSSKARQDLSASRVGENKTGERLDKDHSSGFQPTENPSGASVEELPPTTSDHTLSHKSQDYQVPVERGFNLSQDDVANRDIPRPTHAEGQTEIGNLKVVDIADAQQINKDDENEEPWDVPVKKGKKGKKQRKDKLTTLETPQVWEDSYVLPPESCQEGKTEIGEAEVFITADVEQINKGKEDDGTWDVPVKKGKKGKNQHKDKSVASEIPQVSEDSYTAVPEGSSNAIDATTSAEQMATPEDPPVPTGPGESSELAITCDDEESANEKGFDVSAFKMSQLVEGKDEPALRSNDLIEVEDQGFNPTSVEDTSLPQDDLSTFSITEKSKKGKKGKKQQTPLIWEDETATKSAVDQADAVADEMADSSIAPVPPPTVLPPENYTQQSNAREAEKEQNMQEQRTHEQYNNIPSIPDESRGTIEEPSQQHGMCDDYFSVPHAREAAQVGEKVEVQLPESRQDKLEQNLSIEPQESQKMMDAVEGIENAPDAVDDERASGELPSTQHVDADWGHASTKKSKKGKKSVEMEMDTPLPGAQRVDERSEGQATPREFTGTEGIAATAAAGLGLGIIATEALQLKDSKKESKKGKKGKKATKWADVEDEGPAKSTEQQENIGQAQASGWPPEPQGPAIPPTHFQDTPPLSPDVPQDISVAGVNFERQSARDYGVNRDSAIQVSDSPMVAEGLPYYRVVRDSGYQDTEPSPVIAADPEYESKPRESEARNVDFGMEPFERDIQSHHHGGTPAENPSNVSVEVSPEYDVSITRPGLEDHSLGLHDDSIRHRSNRRSRDLTFDDLRESSPVSSTTKDRSSVLFQSSPSTREELADRPQEHFTLTKDPVATQHTSHAAERELLDDVQQKYVPTEQSSTVDAERALHITSPTGQAGSSLFGGPMGTISDVLSPPRSPFSPDGSTRRRLGTITEYNPEESPLHKKSRHLSDIGSPERGVKSLRRSSRPHSLSQQRVRSPPTREGTPKNLISTDDLIARLSWPPVDEDKHAVDLERSRSRSRNADPSHHSNAPAVPREGERRSMSGASIRSGDSINAIIRTPDHVRSVSGQSFRSSGTPPLRRVDHRVSGDLRLANKKSEAKLAKELEAAEEHDNPIPSSSTYDPIKDKGKTRVKDMADVYEGWGDVHGQLPISPTRPPSMRRQQSLQVLDLETKLDQLVSENRLLQNAKSTAEKGLEEATHVRNSEIENYKVALQTRDSFLSQKDAELNQLKHVLQGLQSQVARLTEVNHGLSATTRGIDEHEQRIGQLQAEHANTHQKWQQSIIELDELRKQHSQLSAGMEDIVRHEVNVALEEKNLELRKVYDELEATKEQVRMLQRQILASKNSDDLIVTRDEDYFDEQCQKLCGHVQQWVLRFSKFSDTRACFLSSEIRDENIVDRFENAILDGSDVDNYLVDRVKRRDVFMSVVMTMIFDYIFTRYLFGMDREQRQKLKSLQSTLSEVGPMMAVHKWRATTLTLLSRRQAFVSQRAQDTEAVMEEIYKTLTTFLPPPSHLVNQIQNSLRNVIGAAVDLHIEMRTQRAEYVMLPPLQPEYDSNGDLARKVYFNAALMNERSGDTSSNDALEAQHAVVRMVLFPLVVKRGDDSGVGDEEIVVCPAQVLIAKPGKEKKTVRVMSVAGSTAGARSEVNLGGSDVGMGNMI